MLFDKKIRSPLTSPMGPKHLPYCINPEDNRFHYYETHWKKVALDLLARHCSPHGQSVLDYGCGRGETLQIFGEAGFRVTGSDVDAECVRLASRHGPACLLQPEAPLLQFGEKSFDIITCFHVLEHVDAPRKTLGELSRIARQFVVVAVPNLRQLHRLFSREIDLSSVNEGHLQSWDHWHFRNLAERYCGLELVEWGFDATVLPLVSNLSCKILGNKMTIRLETGLFRRLFPFHGISVLGLFRVKQS
jgi:ubiquinone/menaquinone biosynthesis C-methylase UbiE